MITNKRQYLNTRAAARRFAEALAQPAEADPEIDPAIQQAIREAMEGELAELQAQLADYEQFASGTVRRFILDSFDELPDILIKARIASGLTQQELADELGIKKQQMQRYEATRYQSASFSRIADVVLVLRLKLHARVSLPDTDVLLPPGEVALVPKDALPSVERRRSDVA